MIFQPAILALLLAAAAGALALAAAAPAVVDILRHWDPASGSERQLRLERRTYLLSTLIALVVAIQLVALLLFVFNADRMAVMFVGAMCAVGTLNVNPFGFPALYAQIAAFFFAAAWLVLNHADNQAPDYPLLRAKYWMFLAMAPILAVAAALELRYFLDLRADVITSCCGSLFSPTSKTISGDAAAFPPLPSIAAFYLALAVAIAAAATYGWRRRGGYLVAASAVAAFVAAMTGIVSVVSLYVYEHPHHHCPFCLLKADYAYQGYWLYLPLFAATAAGLGVGILRPFAGVPSLAAVVPRIGGRLAWIAAAGFGLFAVVASFMIWRSNLILIEG